MVDFFIFQKVIHLLRSDCGDDFLNIGSTIKTGECGYCFCFSL